MEFSLDLLVEFMPVFWQGILTTLAATLFGFVLALLVGAAMLALIRGPARSVALVSTWTLELIRSTPLLIQVYFLFFVLPDFGVRLPAFVTGVLALGLHHGAYVAETYRAGIDAVPRGQWDAAVSLNYAPWQAYRYLIVPQAIPVVVPALGNTLITMLKDTPILSAITVTELMFVANQIGSERFQYTEPVTFAAIVYLVLSLAAAAVVARFERHFRRNRA